MLQRYTMGFSCKNNLAFIVALKIVGFPIRFSSIFKVIFNNFGVRIVILYLLFVSSAVGTI